MLMKGRAALQSIFGIRLLISLLDVVDVLMFIRALLSWIPFEEESRFEQFLINITEPFIIPMRLLLGRFERIRTLPIDIPFFATLVLLSVVSALLQLAV